MERRSIAQAGLSVLILASGRGLHIREVGVEEAVDELYEVGALLVAAVDTALDLQRFDGVDLGGRG